MNYSLLILSILRFSCLNDSDPLHWFASLRTLRT